MEHIVICEMKHVETEGLMKLLNVCFTILNLRWIVQKMLQMYACQIYVEIKFWQLCVLCCYSFAQICLQLSIPFFNLAIPK